MSKEYDQQFIDYIENTGGSPLIKWFDDDWEPIGPMVRRNLKSQGLICEKDGKIYLVKAEGRP